MSPRGDEHTNYKYYIKLSLFQFTSPQGDELAALDPSTGFTEISIHVSARRRTGTKQEGLHPVIDFNSRLREETNRCCNNHQRIPSYFNSRLRKETNHNRRLLLNGYSGISIHVSARRRTQRNQQLRSLQN